MAKEIKEKKKRATKVATPDDGIYRMPYPLEQRRRFWEYDLNPITGMPAPGATIRDKTYEEKHG